MELGQRYFARWKMKKIERYEIRFLGESLINKYMIEGFRQNETEACYRDFARTLTEAAEKLRLYSIGLIFW
jgi:hypothetical protein